MDISILKYFITVAQTEHMSRAAEQLNITQPSLSTSIRRLEAELGFPLFDRTGRGIQLNEYGAIYLKAVVQANALLDGAINEIKELQQNMVSFTRLACSNSSTNARLIDHLLSNGAHLSVNNIPQDWEKALLNNECDLVITMGNLHSPHIEQQVIYRHKILVVVSKSHPLAQKESVTLKELLKYPFCSTDSSHSFTNIIKENYPQYNFRPQITFMGRTSADILNAVRTGRCIGLVNRHNLIGKDEFVILSVEDFDAELPIYLYWRKSSYSSPAMTTLRSNIAEFYKDAYNDCK